MDNKDLKLMISRYDMRAPSGEVQRGWSDLLENQLMIMEALHAVSVTMHNRGPVTMGLERRILATKEFLSGRG